MVGFPFRPEPPPFAADMQDQRKDACREDLEQWAREHQRISPQQDEGRGGNVGDPQPSGDWKMFEADDGERVKSWLMGVFKLRA